MLVDAHCHLDDEQFGDDLDAVVARAVDAGVVAIVTAGGDVASSQVAVALAEKYEQVYAAVGIHPHHAASFGETALKEIRALAQHRKVVAIGEIGLDFHYADGAPREVQERNLIAHLDLAEELGKPVVIHDRDAHRAVMDILRQRNGKPRGMLHCFSGDLEMARQAIDLGYLISFAGNVTFSNARQLQAIARAITLDRILIETDAPYLSPKRGRRNEPANVAEVAAKIAELMGVEESVVATTTAQNSKRLFGFRTME
ncbi:MAG: TatD family hydrolase [Chloroflexi bacterium]|nr:TatD family hydrolase [Chloroflexota bacterium]